MANQAHQLTRSVQRKWAGPALELQSGFFRGAVTLGVVTLVTASDQILPRGAPATRAGNYVVQRQLRRWKCVPAELAGVVVAQQDILAGQRSGLLGDVAIRQQPDHRRHLQRLRRRVHLSVIELLGLGDSLQQQDHSTANGRDVNRLESGIEH